MVGVAAGDRVALELAEMAREGDVLGARDVLVAEEQHPVAQQQASDLGDQRRLARGDAEVDVRELGADRVGEGLDVDRVGQRSGATIAGAAAVLGVIGLVSVRRPRLAALSRRQG
jgi:hypothetical protein